MHPRFFSLILFLAIVLLAAGCGPGEDRFRLKGRLDNVRQAEFYVYSEEGTFDGVDTIRIEDGKFSYERELRQPVILRLLYPNFSGTYLVAEPGKEIKMHGDAAKLGEADISGSEENELLTEFRLANFDKPENNVRMAAAQFVRDHPATLAALAVFTRYFATARTPDPSVALPLLDVLKKAQPANPSVLALDFRLRPLLETGIGRRCPDFEAVTLTGRKLTLADFSGKPFVVFFWSSWNSSDCPGQLQMIHRLRRAYPDRLRLLGVSLDASAEQTRRYLTDDSLKNIMVCEGEAFDSPLVRRLGMRTVPGNLLVDGNGKIVDRDVPAKEFEDRVARLLK